uniref:Uncharacterized protein n=1 Tax=Setaria viridis TaxID=4556 RepID=A0A4U6TH79_SETVI|nr:hypothetical protein SEVIR_8G109000v2 [Setaria viridis]
MERANIAGQGSRNRQRSRQNQEEDGVELAQLREVAFVNNYAVIRAYTLMGLKNFGYLALTWWTVDLLGGFVTSLNRKNFGILTFISLLQAAGYGALPCFGIAISSLLRQNYGIDPGDASTANLTSAFNIYFSLTARRPVWALHPARFRRLCCQRNLGVAGQWKKRISPSCDHPILV